MIVKRTPSLKVEDIMASFDAYFEFFKFFNDISEIKSPKNLN
jgi:hypothetical protein